MTHSYQDTTKILIDNGWTKINPAVFHKNNLELFFDNSHCVELYRIKSAELIIQSRIESAEDLITFLDNIDWQT